MFTASASTFVFSIVYAPSSGSAISSGSPLSCSAPTSSFSPSTSIPELRSSSPFSPTLLFPTFPSASGKSTSQAPRISKRISMASCHKTGSKFCPFPSPTDTFSGSVRLGSQSDPVNSFGFSRGIGYGCWHRVFSPSESFSSHLSPFQRLWQVSRHHFSPFLSFSILFCQFLL